jgi:hypothetical protein
MPSEPGHDQPAGPAAGLSRAGQVAVVTGGSAGLGLAIAAALAQAGTTVVLASRSAASCAVAAEQLSARTGMAVHGRACDVTDERAVGSWLQLVRLWLVTQAANLVGGLVITLLTRMQHASDDLGPSSSPGSRCPSCSSRHSSSAKLTTSRNDIRLGSVPNLRGVFLSSPGSQVSCSRRYVSAWLNSRETCIWEMPSCWPISAWVKFP